MSKLNLKHYDCNDLYIYTSLKNIDDETREELKSLKGSKKCSVEIKDAFVKNMIIGERKNSVKWLNLDKNADLLEVNTCLGALTEYFCDNVKSVTSIEFAKSNAEITQKRLSRKTNLEIIVGNLKDIELDKKFDYIVLNDVLEFAVLFFEENPYETFIDYFKKLLKPTGKMIFLVSNKYGIKSWAGMPSEHTSIMFDELTNYASVPVLSSFSKKEVDEIIKKAGFKYLDTYYLVPNLTVTKQVLTDESLNLLNPMLYVYDRTVDNMFFDTRLVINDLNKSGEFPFFANSFLICAYNENKQNEKVYYSKIYDKYKTEYVLKGEEKYIKKYSETLTVPDIDKKLLLPYEKQDNYYISEVLKGKTLYQTAKEYLQQGKEQEFFDLVQEFIDFIRNIYKDVSVENFKVKSINKCFEGLDLKKVVCVKNAVLNLDFNTVIKNNKNYIITEYDNIQHKKLPLNYLIFAGLYPLIHIKYNIDIISYMKKLNFTTNELLIYDTLYQYFNMN